METVMSVSIIKLAPALLKAQKSMVNAVKDAKNPFFKSQYADLNAVREAAHPSLNDNGITVLQPLIQKDGKSFVRTLLLHESGEYLASDVEVVAAKQNDPQAYGSAVSYARRYGLQALLSIGAEDDDGEKGMGRVSKTYVKLSPPVLTPTPSVVVAEVTTTTTSDPVVAKPATSKPSFKKPPVKQVVTETTEGWE